jgi:CRP-like cAMP-binding protein
MNTRKALTQAVETILPPCETVLPDNYIIRQGDQKDDMFFVETGRFRLVRTVGENEVDIAEVGAGNMVGELSLFSGWEQLISVKAVTHSVIYRINAKDFLDNHLQAPTWYFSILKQMANRIFNTSQLFDAVCSGN